MLRTILIVILALLLVGIVGGIVVYFNKTHQALKVAVVSPTPQAQTKIVTVTPAPSVTPLASANPDSTPVKSATLFYTSYVNCAKQNGSNCDYKNSPYVDSVTLSANLASKQSSGGNNILCAQNTPTSFQVVSPKTVNDTSTVSVKESFGGTIEIVSVDLKLEDGNWKITDITCPTP